MAITIRCIEALANKKGFTLIPIEELMHPLDLRTEREILHDNKFADVRKLMLEKDVTFKQLAAHFKVTRSAISNAVHGKRYHLKNGIIRYLMQLKPKYQKL